MFFILPTDRTTRTNFTDFFKNAMLGPSPLVPFGTTGRFQAITYSAEAIIDVNLRFGEVPSLDSLKGEE